MVVGSGQGRFPHFVFSYMSPWIELLDIVLASLLGDGPACQGHLQPHLNAKKIFFVPVSLSSPYGAPITLC